MRFSRESLGIPKEPPPEPKVIEKIIEVPAKIDEAELVNKLTKVIEAKMASVETSISNIKLEPHKYVPYTHTIVRDGMGLIVEIKSTPVIKET